MGGQIGHRPGQRHGQCAEGPGEEADLVAGPANRAVTRTQQPSVSDDGERHRNQQDRPGGGVDVQPSGSTDAERSSPAHRRPVETAGVGLISVERRVPARTPVPEAGRTVFLSSVPAGGGERRLAYR